MKRYLIIAIALAVAAAAAVAAFVALGNRGVKLRILYTTSLDGRLEPVFVEDQPTLGGVARVSALEKSLRTPDTFVVDTGNFVPEYTPGVLDYHLAIARATVAAMNEFGVEAANIGMSEQALGRDTLLALAAQAKFPLVSASLVDADTGEYAFKPFVVVERGGVRVAFVGILDKDLIEQIGQQKESLLSQPIPQRDRARIEAVPEVGAGFKVLANGEALARVAPLVRDKADVVVLLAFGADGLAPALGRYENGETFSMVLGGIDEPREKPGMDGRIPVFFNGANGRTVGKVDFRYASGRARLDDWQPVPVTTDIKGDGALADLVRDMRKSLAGIDPNLLVDRNPAPGGNSYVGSAACAHCHRPAYEIWQGTAHAKSLESLKREDAQYDPACLLCHVTADQDQDGYVSEEKTPALAGVGCESCHGRGATHVRLLGEGPQARMFVPSPQICVRCHDAKNSPKFQYKVYWPMIQHGRGRAPGEPVVESTAQREVELPEIGAPPGTPK